MPKAGEMMEEGIVVEWLVEVGEHVEVEQPVAVVSTDKVDIDVESPSAGTVTRLLAEPQQTVKVGDPLLELEVED
jgi:pyruvate/2-oxoglutarate dehydrogenase complex dihydrolipoamide acyltransferase (E2) component